MAKRHIIPIFVPHMGCPHDCVFCNQRKIAGQEILMTAEIARQNIEQALSIIEDKTDVQVAFYGGSFTAIEQNLRTSLLSVAHEFIKIGLLSSIRISTRPDYIDEQILSELRDFGVKTIELGAQSMDKIVLNKSKRGHTAEHVKHASMLIRQYGFELGLQVMTGLPFDNRQKSVFTANKIAGLKPDFVRIYPTVVVEQTELFEQYKNNQYEALSINNAVLLCADMLEIFDEHKIPVIRIGINPTEDLSNGKAIAGAYHPALGEMVYSEVLYRKIVKCIDDRIKVAKKAVIYVNFKDISKAIGQKRTNIIKLQELFPNVEFKVYPHENKDIFNILIKYE